MAKKKTSTGPWTKEEVKALKKQFPRAGTAEVAAELGRSVSSVQAKAYSLGLSKTKKYLKSIGRA